MEGTPELGRKKKQDAVRPARWRTKLVMSTWKGLGLVRHRATLGANSDAKAVHGPVHP